MDIRQAKAQAAHQRVEQVRQLHNREAAKVVHQHQQQISQKLQALDQQRRNK